MAIVTPSTLGSAQPDIVIAGAGATAVATVLTPGLSVAGVTSGDAATVTQNAINSLALQNGGGGGMIAWRGKQIWSSQVITYPGIALVGQGPLGNKTVQNTGASIQSTFNGNALVITGVGAGNDYFPYLSNFSIFGDSGGTKPLQNLIHLDASGGLSINDCFIDHVGVFNAGQHGIDLDATATLTKLWIDNCYLEGCVGNGLNATAGVIVRVAKTYIFGQTGWGIFTTSGAAPSVYALGNVFSTNTAGGIDVGGFAADAIISDNSFADNGSNTSTNAQVLLDSNCNALTIKGNTFRDSRGASAVQYHLRVSRSGWCKSGAISGNAFDAAAQVLPIQANYNVLNKLAITGNTGYNDTLGKLATPFNTAHVGMEGGGGAAPTASTVYTVCGSPIYLVSTAGTGVSISIADPKGNAVQSGLATFAGQLPPGYTINFGAFSVAPTLYVGVA